MLTLRRIAVGVVLFAACAPKPTAQQPEPVATATANLRPAPPERAKTIAAPKPLVARGHAVDWWLAFKFNAATFTGCSAPKACPFGGDPQAYRAGEDEQFAFASSEAAQLAMQTTCVGETDQDPVGATFGQVYDGDAFHVLWNDQFYEDPRITGCGTSCGAPWAHSKGMLAWGSNGEGFVMQVTTPSWPAAGNKAHPRAGDGNTLGCVKDDDVLVSQHFFALKLTHEDLVKVLGGLANASVVTDTSNPQIVKNGGPDDVQNLVRSIGHQTNGTAVTKEALSTGATLIAKPSKLHVPPWQMVSAVLGGVPLRVATWWSHDEIPSTSASTPIGCWDASLGKPGAVEIATTGTWQGHAIGLKGGLGKDFNHAKIGVSKDAASAKVIFGDMNQEGSLSDKCASSQNGRGGLFFVVDSAELHASVASLLHGESAPLAR